MAGLNDNLQRGFYHSVQHSSHSVRVSSLFIYCMQYKSGIKIHKLYVLGCKTISNYVGIYLQSNPSHLTPTALKTNTTVNRSQWLVPTVVSIQFPIPSQFSQYWYDRDQDSAQFDKYSLDALAGKTKRNLLTCFWNVSFKKYGFRNFLNKLFIYHAWWCPCSLHCQFILMHDTELTHSCPYFNSGLPILPLKLGHGRIITFHCFIWM